MNRLSAAAIASIAPQVLLIVLLIESNLALSFRVSGAQGCAKFLPPKLVKLLTKALKSGAKMGKTVLQITILSFSYSQFFTNCEEEVPKDPIETGAIADDDYDPAGDAADLPLRRLDHRDVREHFGPLQHARRLGQIR